jgi:hypothetical protein
MGSPSPLHPAYKFSYKRKEENSGGEVRSHLPLSLSRLEEEGKPKAGGLCPVLVARTAVLAAPLWCCRGSEFVWRRRVRVRGRWRKARRRRGLVGLRLGDISVRCLPCYYCYDAIAAARWIFDGHDQRE